MDWEKELKEIHIKKLAEKFRQKTLESFRNGKLDPWIEKNFTKEILCKFWRGISEHPKKERGNTLW